MSFGREHVTFPHVHDVHEVHEVHQVPRKQRLVVCQRTNPLPPERLDGPFISSVCIAFVSTSIAKARSLYPRLAKAANPEALVMGLRLGDNGLYGMCYRISAWNTSVFSNFFRCPVFKDLDPGSNHWQKRPIREPWCWGTRNV